MHLPLVSFSPGTICELLSWDLSLKLCFEMNTSFYASEIPKSDLMNLRSVFIIVRLHFSFGAVVFFK